MNNTDKFLADVKRIVKRNHSENPHYDGLECSRQVANLFCSYNKELGNLPNSIAEYWLNTYVRKSSDLGQEPSSRSLDWLADALEFLAGEESELKSITAADWVSLRDFVDFEAEDLPMEVLSSLMGTLLERGVL